MFPNLCPKGFGRHQESPGETVRGLLLRHLGSHVHDYVPKLMSQRETLTFPPLLTVHDDNGHGAFLGTTHARRQAVDIRQINGKNLDALLLQYLNEVWNRVMAQSLVTPKTSGGAVGLEHVPHHGIGGFTRTVPFNATKVEQLLNHEITLQKV